jgi:phenylpropionate dioxygenase-like ring-hydroxylating dioxygenase large terminal subunit
VSNASGACAETDNVLRNDWHPVAAAGELAGGGPVAAHLMGCELALWRSASGALRAWEDRCPHRGTRLSLGRVAGDSLTCVYHGWRFGADGRCLHVPSQPTQKAPENACAKAYRVEERYGLIWVCLGDPARAVLPFPEYEDPRLRKVLCGPYDVATSGPRIVENFLDMAHFAFVHAGILGDPAKAEVRDCRVEAWSDGAGGTGVIATDCFAWQPQTNSLAHGGSDVEYTYRVVRPLTAILTKVPEAQRGFQEAISLHVQPLGEETSRVWIILAMTDFSSSDQQLRAFQDRIFLQDKPILENQVPRRLPLVPGTEMPVRSDRMSMAYRRYLRESGMQFGVWRE